MDNNNSVIPLSQAVETIKTVILQGQYEALKNVNRVQLAVYYSIGKYLSKNTRRIAYGSGAIKEISEQLHKEMPGLRGFSTTQLYDMRKFYEAWTILDSEITVTTVEPSIKGALQEITGATVISQDKGNQIDIFHVMHVPDVVNFPIEDFLQVPFTHHMNVIAKVKDNDARYYYIRRTAKEHLSVEALEKLIKQHAYENQDKIPNNFIQTMSDSSLARKAVMMFKDSYALEFINTEEIGERDKQDIDEKLVEQTIVHNIKKFIMTFGNDFTFVGNQYHLEIYGVEHFPDLVFFNRELNALVVVELKIGEFKSSYLGQLTTYLKILDAKVKKTHENPSIGIVLCKSANKEYVEFVIQEFNRPMGVATYTTAADMPENLRKALPDIEELKKILSSNTNA